MMDDRWHEVVDAARGRRGDAANPDSSLMCHPSSFFSTGGTLPPDAPSYVERSADRELLDGLLTGEFCYVLTARQMGKSSLMVRAAARLREMRAAVAVVDLTAIGHAVDREQWYFSLLLQIVRRLGVSVDVKSIWREEEGASLLQRWVGGIETVVAAFPSQSVVIFLDEIDQVRALPFSTDEFFAAIRAFYNRRSEDPAFRRLAFCLLGVATPSDLIRDVRLTPFNIGRRIELLDFTHEEASPLAGGLRREPLLAEALLERVLTWTGGHPYLTQRLCQAVAESGQELAPEGVDRLGHDLFLSPQARAQDDNLLFVRDRLLNPGAEDNHADMTRVHEGGHSAEGHPAEDLGPTAVPARTPSRLLQTGPTVAPPEPASTWDSESHRRLAALLDLYSGILSGRTVRDEETNPLVSALKLSGIAVADGRALRVRNRIYAQVFDRRWVQEHMPDAEKRRQRRAFRRGVMAQATASLVALSIFFALAAAAIYQRNAARSAAARDQALQWQTRQALYASNVPLAQVALQNGNARRAGELLDAIRPVAGEQDLRGFEWRYLWNQAHQDLCTLQGHTGVVYTVAFSPDSRLLASASQDQTVRLWDMAGQREVASLPHPGQEIIALAFSPDGRTLATASQTPYSRAHPVLTLWDIASRHPLRRIRLCQGPGAVAFSMDGRYVGVGGDLRRLQVFDIRDGREELPESWSQMARCGVPLPSRGDTPSTGESGFEPALWHALRPNVPWSPDEDTHVLAVSPDGRVYVTLKGYSDVKLWDARHNRLVRPLSHESKVLTVAFSPDSYTLATGSDDNTIRLWDLRTFKERRYVGHWFLVNSVAFSPDGKLLASGSSDRTIKLWPAQLDETVHSLEGYSAANDYCALSPGGGTLAAVWAGKTTSFWDTLTGRKIGDLGPGSEGPCVLYSPNGALMATWHFPGDFHIWDVRHRRPIRASVGPFNAFFSYDGATVALYDGQRRFNLEDARSGRPLGSVEIYTRGTIPVAYAPDGDTMAFVGGDIDNVKYGDGTLEVWSMRTRRRLLVVRGASSNGLPCVAFSPDGRLVAAGGWDRRIRIWELSKGPNQQPVVLQDYAGMINGLAFSPDGRTLAAANEDHTIKLWNLPTRQEVAVLSGHSKRVLAVAFSRDGNTLISVGADGTSRLWRAAPFSQTDAPGAAQR